MKKLVVTGYLGHIGTGFVPGYVAGDRRWQQVWLLDRLRDEELVAGLRPSAGLEVRSIQDDICTGPLDEYFAGADVVLHLAAVTNAEASVAMAEEVERVNLDGTRRVAEACVRTRTKLLFVSTTSVYGPQSDLVGEDCGQEDLNPQSPYASSKLEAERLLEALGETDGLQFVTCRFGTIFGPSPRMRFHTVVNKFVRQACSGEPLTVWRTALHQRRPYLDLTDAGRALGFILDRDLFDRRVYNVLTVNASVQEVVDVIRSHVDDVELRFVDSPILNQLSYRVSRRRFEEQGFRFGGSLERGIQATVAALRDRGLASRGAAT